jgi:omega-amidase
VSDSLRIALVQMAVTDGQPTRNVERAIAAIEAAPAADLYLLPELWTTGYDHAGWPDAALGTPSVHDALQQLSARRRAAIGGSLIDRAGAGLVNRFWLCYPDGRPPVTYDKGHLFAPMREDQHLVAGNRRVSATLDGWTAGLSLCFDLRFPEMYRLGALDGADLFLVASEWPAERAAALRTLALARAIENQAYLALVNRIGTAATDGTVFGGGSMLVAPDGTVVADAGTAGENVVIGVADRSSVAKARTALAVLPLRRPGLDT